jgi:hypothetical protein
MIYVVQGSSVVESFPMAYGRGDSEGPLLFRKPFVPAPVICVPEPTSEPGSIHFQAFQPVWGTLHPRRAICVITMERRTESTTIS